jgi:hypothetical protein
MTYKMKDLRNTDLNLYNFVASSLYLDGYIVLSGYNFDYVTSGIYLMDGFPEDYNNIKIPAIAIEHSFSNSNAFQIGTGKEAVRRFEIDIYARTDGERDDLGETVYNYFSNSMPIYDYNSVLTSGVYLQVGLADFSNVMMRPIRDATFAATKHQMTISLNCKYVVNSGVSLV